MRPSSESWEELKKGQRSLVPHTAPQQTAHPGWGLTAPDSSLQPTQP